MNRFEKHATIAVATAVMSAGLAFAAGLIQIEAEAQALAFPEGPFHGDCLFRNGTSTETIALQTSALMTFADGSSAPASSVESTVLGPGEALVFSVYSLVPANAPAGGASFVCRAEAEVIDGERRGETSVDVASDAFVVRGTKVSIR